MLTFKRKLILTKAQEKRIDGWISTCRFVYNMAKEIQEAAYKNKGIYIHRYTLIKQLAEIKDIEWVADVPAVSLQAAVERLDRTYQAFFKGSGYPKWASKRQYRSILFKQDISIDGNKIRVPKMGFLKMFKDSAITGKIKLVTIRKNKDGYYANILTDSTKNIQNQDKSQVLGIDMGISHFCIDSNGNFIKNPRYLNHYKKKISAESRSLSRKKKGGKNWLKQSTKIARLHLKIANLRRDFVHKASTRIAKENSFEVGDSSYASFKEAKYSPAEAKLRRQIDSVYEMGGGIIFTTDSTTAILTERAIDSLYRLDSSFSPVIEHSHIPKK